MGINLVAEGFSFMVLGMTSVFLFLIIMVMVLKIQGFLLELFFKNEEELKPACPQKTDDSEIIAVISSAIFKFKCSKS